MLYMYEIEHDPTVKDWVIARNEQEAITMLEDFNYELTMNHVSFDHCKVTRLAENEQTMTKYGLMTVRQIIEHYGEPYYVKAG